MRKFESGEYYWVKYHGEFTIGQYDSSLNYWAVIGSDEIFDTKEFTYIGDKIEKPNLIGDGVYNLISVKGVSCLGIVINNKLHKVYLRGKFETIPDDNSWEIGAKIKELNYNGT